jgi:hypothetical protein
MPSSSPAAAKGGPKSIEEVKKQIKKSEEAENKTKQLFEDIGAEAAKREPKCLSGNPRDWLPKGTKYEPVGLNFADLARKSGKYLPFRKLSLGEQTDLIRRELTPKHLIIDPNSIFMRRWDIIMALCLVFVAFVTPFEVAFLESKPRMDLLFYLNRILDVLFALDMVLNFYVKVKVQDSRGQNSRWLRRRSDISWNYIKKWFLIDLITVMPIEVLAKYYDSDENNNNLSKMKFIRVIRLLRLLKLIRVLRASRMIARWESYIAMSYAKRSLIKFLASLALISHNMACLWGLAGRYYLMMDCSSGYPEFEKDSGIKGTPLNDVHNWIVALSEGKSDSPDNACYPFTVYVWALHWAVMSVTSIGYGDISPQRTSEYCLCILCMFVGVSSWRTTSVALPGSSRTWTRTAQSSSRCTTI